MIFCSVDNDAFWEPTIRFIKERVKCPDSKIYSFQFTYEFPMFDGKIAWHCSEIPFVFHNIDKVPVCNCGEETNRLQEQICQAWVSFARTGKPEISGIEWPACADGDEAVMMLDKECRIRHNPDHELGQPSEKTANCGTLCRKRSALNNSPYRKRSFMKSFFSIRKICGIRHHFFSWELLFMRVPNVRFLKIH